jgi:hypothetical protein
MVVFVARNRLDVKTGDRPARATGDISDDAPVKTLSQTYVRRISHFVLPSDQIV